MHEVDRAKKGKRLMQANRGTSKKIGNLGMVMQMGLEMPNAGKILLSSSIATDELNGKKTELVKTCWPAAC